MTKEDLAATLNNRKYLGEITKEEEKQAAENKLVVIFGYSDDNDLKELTPVPQPG